MVGLDDSLQAASQQCDEMIRNLHQEEIREINCGTHPHLVAFVLRNNPLNHPLNPATHRVGKLYTDLFDVIDVINDSRVAPHHYPHPVYEVIAVDVRDEARIDGLIARV